MSAQHNRLKYGFDKEQLRIYDMDKLAADNVAALASYKPQSGIEMEHDETNHIGYVSTDSVLSENLKQLCTQAHCASGHSGGSGGYPVRFQPSRW